MKQLTLLVSCLAVLSACDEKSEAPKNAPAPAPEKPAAPPKPAIGIDAPGNDPAIVELARKALACKWEGSDEKPFANFEAACPEFKAWSEEKAAFADKKGEATLVAFIEDPDEKVRFLGAKRLGDDLGLLKDNKLAERVLTVAEKTKTQREFDLLGVIIGNVVLEDPALLPRIKALLTSSSTHINMRNAIMTDLLPSNPDNAEVLAITREAAKNNAAGDEKNLARTALVALRKLARPASCEALLENLENTDVDHAGDAMQWMTLPKLSCDAHFDAVLASLDARVKARTATSTFFPIALEHLCDAKGAAKPPQLKKAVALAHKLAEDKTLEGSVRAAAIGASVTCDPKGGKAYAGKFKKETDEDIKETVARVTARK